jgi:tRNA pseudouridine38-40 synthase
MSIPSYPSKSGCGVGYEPSIHSKLERVSSTSRDMELTYRTCDSRVYEYLLPTYCLLPPASDDALAKHLDTSSPGWREGLGEAAAFADAWVPEEEEEPAQGTATQGTGEGEVKQEGGETKEGEPIKIAPKKAGEFERRRGWRCDQPTLERFRALIKEYVGTQYVAFIISEPV